jgi:small subunit ribosomal protein S5
MTNNQNNQKKENQEKQPQEFEQKLLNVARVVRVMAGGRRFRFRATVAIGNRNGKVGVGVAKGQDVSVAVEKAVKNAKKHLIEVPIKDGTIPHVIETKYGGARVLLKPGAKGKGVVAGGAVRVVCSLAGIQDVSGKILSKTKNALNNARATVKALNELEK